MIMFKKKIIKVGDYSHAVVIPFKIIRDYNLKKGDVLRVTIEKIEEAT